MSSKEPTQEQGIYTRLHRETKLFFPILLHIFCSVVANLCILWFISIFYLYWHRQALLFLPFLSSLLQGCSLWVCGGSLEPQVQPISLTMLHLFKGCVISASVCPGEDTQRQKQVVARQFWSLRTPLPSYLFCRNSASLKQMCHIEFSPLKLFWNSHFLSKDAIGPLALVSPELLVI